MGPEAGVMRGRGPKLDRIGEDTGTLSVSIAAAGSGLSAATMGALLDVTVRLWRFASSFTLTSGEAFDIRLDLAAKGETLAGSSKGGTTPSSLASQSAADHTAFSASQDAERSKL